jgi:hypothetical protein
MFQARYYKDFAPTEHAWPPSWGAARGALVVENEHGSSVGHR